ncbi:hypothetical protein [Streptomyces sp. LNU-CPARS28]|uniref:hypothetical protein n=1 Tax=Streptomyces sp. LNU-CPARS28 TaxID=3137371 RepID=UPI00313595FA
MAYAEKVYKVRNGKQTKQYTWRACYKKPDGSKGTEPGFETKRLAEDYGNQQEALMKMYRWVDPERAQTPFGKWAREWMASRAPRGQTVTTRWDRLDTHILPRWDHTPLISITWFDAEAWANSVSLTHDDSTASQCLTLMSQIMTGAVDAGRILVNPLAGRRRSRPAAVRERIQQKAIKRAEGEARWADPERLLRVARRLGPLDGTHLITTAFAGPRWGEGLALRKDSLGERKEPHGGGFFTCPVLRVREEVAEYQTRDPATGKKGPMFFGLEPLKTDGSLRDVDLPPFLHFLTLAQIARLPDKVAWLFCTRSGKWWRNSNFGRQVMRPGCDGREALEKSKGHRAREAWEPIIPGLTMDLLRHTHDTYQAQLDVAEPLQFEQAGHRRAGIKAVYQHPTPDMRIHRLNGLQEIFERAMRNLGWDRIWEGTEMISGISPKRSLWPGVSGLRSRSIA